MHHRRHIFSCNNAIPPRGCGLGVCKSDVSSQTSSGHCAAIAALSLCNRRFTSTLQLDECMARYDETDRRTTGSKGTLRRSRDIYYDDKMNGRGLQVSGSSN
ncbi:hypothetical protein EV363DRAFT_1438656 [Boletus edulis]|nr:hypothetical protein EV363DRAFT_1438656 [Boletus edulis]